MTVHQPSNINNQPSILITGALGHIGSKLIDNLKPGQFKEVRLIDNLSTQRFPSLFNLPKGIEFSFFVFLFIFAVFIISSIHGIIAFLIEKKITHINKKLTIVNNTISK